jgi:ubiquinone/menaquinone biosynthesis C-methylase UbiE/uncharacterized protein YbaR (Trm112 family)
MKAELLAFLACPKCSGDLEVRDAEPDESGEIRNGRLRCLACSAEYPIRDAIPRFVPAHTYADSFGFLWHQFARTQFDHYSGLRESRNRLWTDTRWPQDMHGQVIVEAGCGAGRFTEHLAASGATIISFDYSNAVEVNHANNRAHANVHFLQGDMYNLPFKPGIADRIFCFGVLQCVPDPQAAFNSLLKLGKPHAQVAVDIYRASPHSLFHGKRYLRVVTSRMDAAKLLPIVRWYVRKTLPLLAAVRKRSPRAAGKLSALLAVTDFSGRLDLDEQKLFEWCLLDTFDTLSPRYEHPQTVGSVQGWFTAAGLEDIDVGLGYTGVVGRGSLPAAGAVRQPAEAA